MNKRSYACMYPQLAAYMHNYTSRWISPCVQIHMQRYIAPRAVNDCLQQSSADCTDLPLDEALYLHRAVFNRDKTAIQDLLQLHPIKAYDVPDQYVLLALELCHWFEHVYVVADTEILRCCLQSSLVTQTWRLSSLRRAPMWIYAVTRIFTYWTKPCSLRCYCLLRSWCLTFSRIAVQEPTLVKTVYKSLQAASWLKWIERKPQLISALERIPDFYAVW
jgi:hypothetical protein